MYLRATKKLSVQAKAAIFFTIATFICKGINFISLPIFAKLLTTDEMGIVTTFNSWQVLLAVFANLALDSGSFNIAMMEYKDDRYKYMSSILVISTISSLIVGGGYFIIKPFVKDFIGLDDSLMVLMILSFIFLPATSFWMLHQRFLYKYKSTVFVTVFSNGFSVLISALITYFAAKKGTADLASVRLVSGNAVLILWGALFYVLILVRGKTLYCKTYLQFALTVNTPLLIHSLAKHILDVSDKTMISSMIGKREVGIYGVLYSISAIALIVWSAINSSLIPYMFECIKENKKGKLSKYVEIMLLVYSVACIGLTLMAPEVLKIMTTEEYMEAVYIMPPIAAGIFFVSLYNIYSNVLLYYKKTNYIMFATFVAAIFNLFSNYIFIKMFGYQAAAYTTLVSYIILAYMQFRFAKKLIGKETLFNDQHLWIIAMFTVIMCIVINAIYFNSIIRYSVIILICGVILFFHKKLIEMFLKIMKKDME